MAIIFAEICGTVSFSLSPSQEKCQRQVVVVLSVLFIFNIVADKFTHHALKFFPGTIRGISLRNTRKKEEEEKIQVCSCYIYGPVQTTFFVVVVFLTNVNCVVYQRAGVWRSNWRGETK